LDDREELRRRVKELETKVKTQQKLLEKLAAEKATLEEEHREARARIEDLNQSSEVLAKENEEFEAAIGELRILLNQQ